MGVRRKRTTRARRTTNERTSNERTNERTNDERRNDERTTNERSTLCHFRIGNIYWPCRLEHEFPAIFLITILALEKIIGDADTNANSLQFSKSRLWLGNKN